jgi:hypothetical protein
MKAALRSIQSLTPTESHAAALIETVTVFVNLCDGWINPDWFRRAFLAPGLIVCGQFGGNWMPKLTDLMPPRTQKSAVGGGEQRLELIRSPVG